MFLCYIGNDYNGATGKWRYKELPYKAEASVSIWEFSIITYSCSSMLLISFVLQARRAGTFRSASASVGVLPADSCRHGLPGQQGLCAQRPSCQECTPVCWQNLQGIIKAKTCLLIYINVCNLHCPCIWKYKLSLVLKHTSVWNWHIFMHIII